MGEKNPEWYVSCQGNILGAVIIMVPVFFLWPLPERLGWWSLGLFLVSFFVHKATSRLAAPMARWIAQGIGMSLFGLGALGIISMLFPWLLDLPTGGLR